MKKLITAAATVAIGIAFTVAMASPASAATNTNPADSPAFKAWLHSSTVSVTPATSSPVATSSGAKSLASSVAAATAKPTGGQRITQKHGGVLLWTSNTLEWYWNSSTITSSSGSQAVGYIFPNTASKGGIVRTLATSAQHNWRGTNVIGTGVVTPWGAVNVYRDSLTDYYTLERNGKYIIK
jgi:hypothetical protein